MELPKPRVMGDEGSLCQGRYRKPKYGVVIF